jgi:hypothetical protein
VALAAGMYRLARAAFTPVVGVIAAALLCTRFDFPFLAARAYIDIPYLAFIVWAAALEAERPRRGTPVAMLLAAASLMRPEAWLLAGLYFLWIAWPEPTRRRLWFLVLAVVPPLIWVGLDAAVTGDPMFSLHHTSGIAEELGRTKSLSDVPSSTVQFLKNLDKVPVFYAGILGVILAVVMAPRRIFMPAFMLVVGIGTFFMVGIAGLSLIDRYLLVPSLMFMVFAAFVIGGWSMLTPGRLRTAWIVGAIALVGYGVAFTLTKVNFQTFKDELVFRGKSHAALKRILSDPAVVAARDCGPLSTPSHKLVPDTRWLLHAGVKGVLGRTDPAQANRIQHGLALYTVNRSTLVKQALADTNDDAPNTVVDIPMAGFHRIAANSFYSVYSSC